MARVEIDNGEPSKAEANRTREIVAFVVWTPMFQSVRHRLHDCRRHGRVRIKVELSADAAHKMLYRKLRVSSFPQLPRPPFQVRETTAIRHSISPTRQTEALCPCERSRWDIRGRSAAGARRRCSPWR